MKSKLLLATLIIGTTLLISCDNQNSQKNTVSNDSTNTQTRVKENNYDQIIKNLIVESTPDDQKEIKLINDWLTKELNNLNLNEYDLFSENCKKYVTDAVDLYWGEDGSISEKKFNEKWSETYDLKHANFSHCFENGNGGWASRKIENNKYLGKLNDGKWFELKISGGNYEKDFSQKLVRVIKVIKLNNQYFIDNFISLSKD